MKMTNLSISVPSEIFLVLRENKNQFAADMKKYTALNLFTSNKLFFKDVYVCVKRLFFIIVLIKINLLIKKKLLL